MEISEKQRELDKIKWEKSVRLGFDACGSFDFCKMCDKNISNPCEVAHNKYYNIQEETIDDNNDDIKQIENIISDAVEMEITPKKAKKVATKKTTTKKKTSKTTKEKTTKSVKKTTSKKVKKD